MELNIGFIGAGKVGCTLGKYFAENDARATAEGAGYVAQGEKFEDRIVLKGYYSLHRHSSQDAARFTGAKPYDSIEDLVGECDIVFITVPDGEISSGWCDISRMDIKGKSICHCSGSLSSAEAFEGIGRTGAFGYSIHPLFAVSDKYSAYSELPGVFFTLEEHEENPILIDEADGKNRELYMLKLTEILESKGNPVRRISSENKCLYHLGAAVASNLVCGLVDLSIELIEKCGFGKNDAVKALAPILKGNMEHTADKGPEKSLTGPVERNDTATVQKHMDAVEGEEREIYRLLSERLVKLAQSRHPNRDYTDMNKILMSEKGRER